MRKIFRSKWFWIVAAVLAVAAIVQWGGKTVVIHNLASEDICQVHISSMNDINSSGPNRILGRIVYPNSYDIHMPLYYRWFRSNAGSTNYLWAVGCGGDVIASLQFKEQAGGFVSCDISKLLPRCNP